MVPIGTAFVVGIIGNSGREALLLTAAHNLWAATKLDPHIQRASSMLSIFAADPVPQLGSTKMYAVSHRGTPARMGRAWWHAKSDIALITARLQRSDGRFDMKLKIDTRPLADGTALIALGYPGMAADFVEPPDYENQRILVGMTSQLTPRPGTVVKAVARDEIGNQNAPGVLHTCRVDSGMSGGPLVEERDGRFIVRAVASRSLSTSANAASGSSEHSFAETFLASLMIHATDLRIRLKSHDPVDHPYLLDLIRVGAVDDLGRAPDWVQLET